MKQRKLTILPLAGSLSLICGGLRLLQNHTGFEADTGLPVSGHLPSVLLPVLLAVTAAGLLLLALRTLPKEPDARSFSETFPGGNPLYLTLAVLGVFLMAASGIWELLSAGGTMEYLTENGLVVMSARSVTGTSVRIMGALSVAAAVCLFFGVAASRRETVSPLPLLAVPVCLLARLILVYRLDSVNPVLADYYLEILGLVVLILALYRLSGFAVGTGNPALFSAYTGMSVILALPLLADGGPAAILHLGGTLALVGFQQMARNTETD